MGGALAQQLHYVSSVSASVGSLPGSAGNTWRRLRYTLLAPFYDLGAAGHERWRRRAISLLALGPGERVLVVGVGTGQDLALLPRDVRVTAVDLAPAMLRRAHLRRTDAELLVMDGERLDLPAGDLGGRVLQVGTRRFVRLVS